MIRKQKKFSWPRKLYDSARIKQENELKEKYGLKNKKEIWKTEAKVKYFRDRAKALITASQEEQKAFLGKLNGLGLNVKNIAEVLALSKEDLFARRLSTIVSKKGLANTTKHARQMIIHKKIMIDHAVVNAPGYLVKVAEENLITLKQNKTPPKKVESPEVTQ